jgi:aryl-alcohol dehydrogenase-like predicted oxidoreductase
MKTTNYAKTGKKIHRIGFGAWQLGNTEFWGHMSVEEGIALVDEAIQKGVCLFDTAPGYASGLSETIIGLAVQGRREDVVINTKFGHTAEGETDFSVFSLRDQIQSSLNRLQTDYLDSIVLHNPSMDILLGQTMHVEELKKLKAEGLIRSFGVSIDTLEEFEAVLDHLEIDVVEILFNIFFQDPAKLFEKAHQKGISIIAKVPLDSGWLTGKYDEFSEFEGIRSRWDDQTILRRAELVKDLKAIVKADDLTPYAINFILSFPEVTAVIPGIRTSEQLQKHLHHKDYVLTKTMKQAMQDLYKNKIEKDPLPW